MMTIIGYDNGVTITCTRTEGQQIMEVIEASGLVFQETRVEVTHWAGERFPQLVAYPATVRVTLIGGDWRAAIHDYITCSLLEGLISADEARELQMSMVQNVEMEVTR